MVIEPSLATLPRAQNAGIPVAATSKTSQMPASVTMASHPFLLR